MSGHNVAHAEMVIKYDKPYVHSWVKQKCGVDLVLTSAIAVSWRGSWSACYTTTATEFPQQWLRLRDLAIMSLR